MSKEIDIEDLLQNDSFVRFIHGKARESEKKYWDKWLKEYPDRKNLFHKIDEFVKLTSHHEKVIPDPQIELKKFLRQIETLPKTSEPLNRKKSIPAKRKGYWSLMAAAIVVIAISTGLFATQFENEMDDVTDEQTLQIVSNSEHHTSNGEKTFLHLPDGSTIVLNANSSLSYKKIIDNKNDESLVEILLDGEAMFNITPAQTKYRVQTIHGDVEVTGTSFWVQSSEAISKAVLEEGEIRVNKLTTSDIENSNELILRPGEMAQFSKSNDLIEVRKVNTGIYTSWVRDVWTFDSTQLSDIALRIEKLFGVQVEITNPKLYEKKLSGTISSDNLQIIKEGLSEAIGEEVIQVDNKFIIGGY